MYIYIHICTYRLVPGPGTTYDGVGGWGGMLTFMWTCRSSWCYAHAGWGGGVGWGGMLTFMWTCRSSWCYAQEDWDNIYIYLNIFAESFRYLYIFIIFQYIYIYLNLHMCMMMMMTTLMKLVNSATKFRHGIDKFYQPNSGLRGSETWDEATYTYMYIYILYIYIIIYVYIRMSYQFVFMFHAIHRFSQPVLHFWSMGRASAGPLSRLVVETNMVSIV